MQIDQTHITIRERGFFEILDLSLQVLRAHWLPLLTALAIGEIPFAILNYWLIGDMVLGESMLWDRSEEYFYWMFLLVVWQIPLATAPITLFLGQATFNHQTHAKRLFRDYLKSFPQMFILQVLLRGILMPFLVTLLLPYIQWPYLNEIILLERNPLVRRGRITTMKRSNSLHRNTGGELFRRWFISVLIAAVLCSAMTLAIRTTAGMLNGKQLSSSTTWLVCYPLALWLVASYFAIVRFLAYLDLRIRREGWEVELSLRAEAERIAEGVWT